MTKEQIEEFTRIITRTGSETEITLKDGTKIIGYFDKRNVELNDKNQWNFFKFPIDNNNKKPTILNGDDIDSIN